MSTGEETGNGNTTIIAGFSVCIGLWSCIGSEVDIKPRVYAGKVAPWNHNDKKYTKEAARDL